MGYNFKEEFISDTGYRWYRDRVSILVQALAFGNVLTASQNLDYAQAIDDFIEGIAGGTQNAEPASGATLPEQAPLGPEDFAEVEPGPFYKCVGEDTWNYLKQGSFRFGTAEYYRTVESNGRDRKEGYGHFHLRSGEKQLNVALRAGNNCVVYCGTGATDDETDQLLRERFGQKRIRIDDLPGFAKRANKCLGSVQFRVVDVAYRDIKNYTQDLSGIERILEITSYGNLTLPALRKLNREFFKTFYEYGTIAGVLVKPTDYSAERERRLVFELRKDRREPYPIQDKKLFDFVTFLPD